MRLHLFISGIVQGVGFRAFTRRLAESYGLRGWVKNLKDGRVEVLVEGDEEILFSFIKDLWKGPKLSRVDKIELLREESDEPLYDFRIEY